VAEPLRRALRQAKRPRFTRHINIGTLVVIVGVLLAFPLLVLAAEPASPRYVLAFAIPSGLSLVLGWLLFRHVGSDDDVSHFEVNTQVGSLTVLLGWLYGFVAGAAPFVIAGYLPPLHALFESVSGWTGTGLTMMDVVAAPDVFLFHRAFMQFAGGLGFVMVVLMFVHSKQAANLYNAEGHPDRVAPRVKGSARAIFLIYLGFVGLGTVLYRLLGMPWFDSLLHSMSALGTGGFSTQYASIGGYGNVGIEIVTAVLMVIGMTNFAVLLLLARGRWRQVSRVSEVRFMALLLAGLTAVVALLLWSDGVGTARGATHHALFTVISAVSTTGFSTIDLAGASQAVVGVLTVAMLVGGGIGSTAGGLKIQRAYILTRVLGAALKRRMMPARVVSAPRFTRAQGRATIDDSLATEIMGFALMYLAVFLAGTFVFTVVEGVSLGEGAFDFASVLSSTGLSVGVVHAESHVVTLVTAMVGMVLGRLEIFIVLIGVHSGWRLSKAWVARIVGLRHGRKVLAAAAPVARPDAEPVADPAPVGSLRG